MWKSLDAGETWQFIGLPESGAIRRVVVHPTNPDLVYVTALGHPFGKNKERGVYRSKDGGQDLGAGPLRQRLDRAPATCR